MSRSACAHVCLRAGSAAEVDLFHAAALAQGALDGGSPGPRTYSRAEVYACFFRDPDGNRIQAATFPAERCRDPNRR